MEELGLPAIVSSAAANLLEGIGAAQGPGGEGSLAVLDGPIDVESLFQLAGGFGLCLGVPEPEPYRDHRVWKIDLLGLILAVGEADTTTVVLSSGFRFGGCILPELGQRFIGQLRWSLAQMAG